MTTLVTGAAGRVGSVGRRIVELLREADMPVRALVRADDERASRLRDLGAEIVVADLTKAEEVLPAVRGCSLVFFCMSVCPEYLEATTIMAAAARDSQVKLLLNMSQILVSEMTLMHGTGSPQHRLHWLSEQVLNWSGVPVTHLRPTVFQENPLFWNFAARSIAKSDAICLPFQECGTAPVAAEDVARVAAKVLLEPSRYAGRTIELTGPHVDNTQSLAQEYSDALGRHISSVEAPLETWQDEILKKAGFPDHVFRHILSIAKLHRAGRYNKYTDAVQNILGQPATRISTTIRLKHDSPFKSLLPGS